MTNGNGEKKNGINGKAHFLGTWAWRLVVGVLLGVLSWNWNTMYTEVHKDIPSKIEMLDEKKVNTTRFQDLCERLSNIERKQDEIMRYLRDNRIE